MRGGESEREDQQSQGNVRTKSAEGRAVNAPADVTPCSWQDKTIPLPSVLFMLGPTGGAQKNKAYNSLPKK